MTYSNELESIPFKNMSDMKTTDIKKLDKKLKKYFRGRLIKYKSQYV